MSSKGDRLRSTLAATGSRLSRACRARTTVARAWSALGTLAIGTSTGSTCRTLAAWTGALVGTASRGLAFGSATRIRFATRAVTFTRAARLAATLLGCAMVARAIGATTGIGLLGLIP